MALVSPLLDPRSEGLNKLNQSNLMLTLRDQLARPAGLQLWQCGLRWRAHIVHDHSIRWPTSKD
jgi:hypothetical protein